MSKTLYEKIWDTHICTQKDDKMCILYMALPQKNTFEIKSIKLMFLFGVHSCQMHSNGVTSNQQSFCNVCAGI